MYLYVCESLPFDTDYTYLFICLSYGPMLSRHLPLCVSCILFDSMFVLLGSFSCNLKLLDKLSNMPEDVNISLKAS